jgi:hypothetical protein
MAVSSSHLSYGDCYAVMDKALEDTHGVRVAQPDMNSCTYFRMRLHQARSIDRRRNCSVYEEGDALFNTSQYDPLVIRIRQSDDEQFWVYVEKSSVGLGKIEALSEVDDQVSLPQPEAQLMLPPPNLGIKRRI